MVFLGLFSGVLREAPVFVTVPLKGLHTFPAFSLLSILCFQTHIFTHKPCMLNTISVLVAPKVFILLFEDFYSHLDEFETVRA